jgi:hypothetical protein
MKQLIFILGISVLAVASCKKSAISGSIRGLYTEDSPEAGRSQLNFVNKDLVIETERGSSYADTFRYSFSPGKIELKPIWTDQASVYQFEFERIDVNTFKIENLYPSIPEAPRSYMIYRK